MSHLPIAPLCCLSPPSALACVIGGFGPSAG